MPKATLQFGDWRPDLALLDNQYATVADNVFVVSNSYQPVPSLLPFTPSALPAAAVGLTSARKQDGSWEIYAGTATNLYKWGWSGWTDVSRVSGGNYAVPAGELWSFRQFGTRLYACNINDVMQYIDVEAGTNFAAAPGSPPQGHSIHVIGDFLVVAGLASNQRRIQWSAINDPSGWTVGLNLSDFQEFPDGGPVKGMAGSEIGYVVQDRTIRLMQFLPGDTNYIFHFSRVVTEKGSISEFGFSTVADILYFVAEDGPYQLAGNQLDPIGQDKVSQWFLANSDPYRRNLVQVVPSNRPYVMFAFYSSTGSNTYDRVLIYNWQLKRWTTASVYAEVWGLLGTHYLDLDTDGTETGDPYLDSPPAPLPPNEPRSLDSFAYVGGRPLVCAINPQGQLCSLNGPPLEATMDTAEAHLVPGMRAYVSEVYPLADTANGTISVYTRERLGNAGALNGGAYPLEITGSASVLTSARLHRFRLTLPAGENWTNAQGLLVEAQPDGRA